MPAEDDSVSELMQKLNVGNPSNNVYDRMYAHNSDIPFVQPYLEEMRGPTDMPAILQVEETWRLGGICKNFESNLGSVHFLMTGMPTKEVYSAISRGFPKLCSTKAVFGGKGYYFTSCSTKAAHQCNPVNWNYETHADRGFNKPKSGEDIYIMFCEVAFGKSDRTTARNKRGIGSHDTFDSIILEGLYTNERNQVINHQQEGYEVCIPRGPFFRNRSVNKVSIEDTSFFYYDEFYVERASQINPCMLARVSLLY